MGTSKGPPGAARLARFSSRSGEVDRNTGEYFAAEQVEDGTVKKATLVAVAGEEIEQVLGKLPDAGGPNDYDAAVGALNRHFNPLANPDRELVRVRHTVQSEGETMEGFHTRVRNLVSRCIGWT